MAKAMFWRRKVISMETAWETDTPTGRPPRHLGRLTGPGRALAAELARAAGGPRPWGVGLRDPDPQLEGDTITL
jgi:hypothetical protein